MQFSCTMHPKKGKKYCPLAMFLFTSHITSKFHRNHNLHNELICLPLQRLCCTHMALIVWACFYCRNLSDSDIITPRSQQYQTSLPVILTCQCKNRLSFTSKCNFLLHTPDSLYILSRWPVQRDDFNATTQDSVVFIAGAHEDMHTHTHSLSHSPFMSIDHWHKIGPA